ncbi:uridine kinase family-domain-containing protein [Lactarius quietus]|nr:uridine kinase family-domain-containing protein [Lactarius quietus]
MDMDLLPLLCLSDLKHLRQTNIPVYSFAQHQRLDETKYLYGATIIIAEGIHALHDPELRKLYDLKVFVQADSDLMLARRIARDTKERGRAVDGILEQYLRYVKPSFDNFVLPSSRHADIIVPGKDNAVAIELISTHIRRQLEQRSRHFRRKMAETLKRSMSKGPSKELTIEDLGLTVLDQTPQLKVAPISIHHSLVERAMEKLPYREVAVETPVSENCKGKAIDAESLCGVTILRSGGPLEQGLQRVISDVAIGSLLVQSESRTGEPLLFHVSLPECICVRDRAANTWVFLLDAQARICIGTGAAGFMAIRVLLDHGVNPAHIIFVTFLVTQSGGVVHLRRTFPDVNIVTGAVDDGLREVWLENAERHKVFPDEDGFDNEDQHKAWVIEPGMGQIGGSSF